MDDGGYIKNRGIKRATHSYTLKEVKYISEAIYENFNIRTSIVKTGAINQYNIYFPKSTLNDLFNIVEPHIHKSMLYKFNN
jgi:hypothetical protein